MSPRKSRERAKQLRGSLRSLSILSADTTYRKVGVSLVDVSIFHLADVQVGTLNAWTGNTSRGLWVQGREISTIERATFAADIPIQISDNPNNSIDIDHFVFRDLYLIGSLASGTYGSGDQPCVLIDSGVNLTNVTFDGDQTWTQNSDGLRWIDTTTAQGSLNLRLQNIRWEQSTNASGYVIRIEHNYVLDGLMIENVYGGLLSNGLYLRTVRRATVKNFYFVRAGGTGLNSDTTVSPLTLENVFFQTGATVSAGAAVTIFDSGASLSSGLIAYRIYDNPSSAAIRSSLNALQVHNQFLLDRAALTYANPVTVDANGATQRTLIVTNNSNFTINAPSNAITGMLLILTIANESGGAMGTITWNGIYALQGAAWTNPATGTNRSIVFTYAAGGLGGGGSNRWYELFRSAADVAN